MIEELGLEDIHTIHGRAEDYAKDAAYREKYDLCVSRAVANLATLSEYCLPYVKVGGMFIPYKSGERIEKSGESAWRRDRRCSEIRIAGNGYRKILCKDPQSEEYG
mgnify:CR=1 FL=1